MPTVLPQVYGYGSLPPPGSDAGGPRGVNVRMVARDFYNASSSVIFFNIIAHPDAYSQNKPASSGGGAANQSGYMGALANLNIAAAMQARGMAWISTVYVDNGNGAGVVILRHRSTGVTITAQPFTQGYYPLLVPKGSDFTFDVAYIDSQGDNVSTQPSFANYPDSTTDHSGGGGTFYGQVVESGALRFQFTDWIVPPCVWSTRNWSTYTVLDFPTTIAVGGTFQQVLPKNPFRKGFLIANGIAAVENLIVSIHQDFETDALATSIGLAPGGVYEQRGLPAYVGAVYAMANTAGHALVLKEYV